MKGTSVRVVQLWRLIIANANNRPPSDNSQIIFHLQIFKRPEYVIVAIPLTPLLEGLSTDPALS